MCEQCWEEFRSPQIDNEKVRNAVKLIKGVYEENCAGGHLHIMLDDWNLDAWNLRFCRQEFLTKAEVQCLEELQQMSLDERISALALHEGFWS